MGEVARCPALLNAMSEKRHRERGSTIHSRLISSLHGYLTDAEHERRRRVARFADVAVRWARFRRRV